MLDKQDNEESDSPTEKMERVRPTRRATPMQVNPKETLDALPEEHTEDLHVATEEEPDAFAEIVPKARREMLFAEVEIEPEQDFLSDAGLIFADMETWIIPVVGNKNDRWMLRRAEGASQAGATGEVAALRRLVQHSGIYAISSMAGPLLSLILAPFLTHHLSPSSYGTLAIINIAITLSTGITQLGLSSAFFRAYNYDYTEAQDRRDVVATVTTLLLLISLPTALVVTLLASQLASVLFGQPLFGNSVALAGAVVLLQNLTVPGMAWLRAEERPWLFSLLSISNLLVTFFGNLLFVGAWHWGIAGSIIANGCGFACIVLCTFPVLLFRASLKIRPDIARGLLAFGLPLVLNSVAYWILQLSDRYLLSLFVSLAWTARYTIAYTLGSALSIVIISPFTLAWPTALFAIAKRQDAAEVFRLVFRWLSMLLLFAAFGLSLAGTLALHWLFLPTYYQAASIIPVIAGSLVFYGIYYVFMAGPNLTRKTWLAAIFTTCAALVNVAVNLVLIPLYGAMGAALSTFIAFLVLAAAAYIANQRLYPLPFEIIRLLVAFSLGIALYIGSERLAQSQTTALAWGISLAALLLYGGCLVLIGKLPAYRGRTRIEELTGENNRLEEVSRL